MTWTRLGPTLQAAGAAVLFGTSAPIIKYVLGDIEPVPLAALLYLGSGTGLLILRTVISRARPTRSAEASLRRADIPWTIGVVLSGGVIAPILLMISLKATPAATASLLLNFEAAATTVLAAIFFREAVGLRIWIAVAVMTAACALLSWQPDGQISFAVGALGVLGACVFWGLDNNLTQNISAKDPISIVMVKGLGSGVFSTIVAFIVGQAFPALALIAGALLVGFLCYGLSTVLFVLSLRGQGAARTSAIYGIAPFVGATLALVGYGEQQGALFIVGAVLMIVAAFLLVGEQHSHHHVHDDLTHEHRLEPDDHHSSGTDSTQHKHDEQGHDHTHSPDIHHRHSHDKEAKEKKGKRG